MRKLRSLTDRLMGRVVPEVTASAIWVTRYRCTPGCGTFKRQKRQCHDSSGQCTPWVDVYCDC